MQLPRCCKNCGYREQAYCYLKNETKEDNESCERWYLQGEPLPFTDPLPDSYISDGDGWE